MEGKGVEEGLWMVVRRALGMVCVPSHTVSPDPDSFYSGKELQRVLIYPLK
jgi:hypothetical protein